MDLDRASSELKENQKQQKFVVKQVAKLMAEPLNSELDGRIEGLENDITELKSGIVESKKHFVDMKQRGAIESSHAYFVKEWSNRKRKCLDAIEVLESATDGTVSLKKCLKGEGIPIER
jgi:hypothetical protein